MNQHTIRVLILVTVTISGCSKPISPEETIARLEADIMPLLKEIHKYTVVKSRESAKGYMIELITIDAALNDGKPVYVDYGPEGMPDLLDKFGIVIGKLEYKIKLYDQAARDIVGQDHIYASVIVTASKTNISNRDGVTPWHIQPWFFTQPHGSVEDYLSDWIGDPNDVRSGTHGLENMDGFTTHLRDDDALKPILQEFAFISKYADVFNLGPEWGWDRYVANADNHKNRRLPPRPKKQ